MLEFIRKCNKPTVLESGGFEKLREIASETFVDLGGSERPLLSDAELQNLSIARGSLNAEERKQIESHVVHTYNFLKRIPWTRDLANVAEYARGHHEKLDGSGYPNGRPSEDIPVQTRVMTIADIYDALTAADRPYKAAMPHERALTILEMEAKAGKLDPQLLQLFIEADVAGKAEQRAEKLREENMSVIRKAATNVGPLPSRG
jgi:HD-GYP domain-containing protein (c-di-GMP phosphodiesterase class II)